MAMASSNAQQPVAGIRLPTLPSNAAIISPANADLCLAILQVVQAHELHIPPKKLGEAITYFWKSDGSGPWDAQYKKWTPDRAVRNMKDRIMSILDYYGRWENDEVPYPSQLQSSAKRLADEMAADETERAARRVTAQIQAQTIQQNNNLREGTLGLLPPARGVGVPSIHEAGRALRQQMANASSLLGQNPSSQNNSSEYIVRLRYFMLSIYHLTMPCPSRSSRPTPTTRTPAASSSCSRGWTRTSSSCSRGWKRTSSSRCWESPPKRPSE